MKAPVVATAVAVLDGRAAFIALPVPEGGHGVFCKNCGAEIRLAGGTADARDLRHEPGCRIAHLLAGASKPVLLRVRRLEGPRN